MEAEQVINFGHCHAARRGIGKFVGKEQNMQKLKRITTILSFVFIALGFGASVWLYTVLHDSLSMTMMIIFFLGLIWFGFNVRSVLKEKSDEE